MGQLLQEHVYA